MGLWTVAGHMFVSTLYGQVHAVGEDMGSAESNRAKTRLDPEVKALRKLLTPSDGLSYGVIYKIELSSAYCMSNLWLLENEVLRVLIVLQSIDE